MDFRRATSNDIKDVNALTIAAKQSWGYATELMQLWLPDLLIDENVLLTQEVWVALSHGEIVSVYSLSTENQDDYELDGFWIKPEYMDQGIGRATFHHLIENLNAKHAKRLKIVSDPNATGFYIKMGAHQVGVTESKPKGRQLPVLEIAFDI